MIQAVAAVLPADFQVLSVLPGAENAPHGLGLREVGGDDRSDHKEIVSPLGFRIQPLHRHVEVLFDDLEIEPVVAEVFGQPSQPFSREMDAIFPARRQIGGGREDQAPGALTKVAAPSNSG